MSQNTVCQAATATDSLFLSDDGYTQTPSTSRENCIADLIEFLAEQAAKTAP